MLSIIERIILRLHQDGWIIERALDNWILAHKDSKGLLFTSLTPGQKLDPPLNRINENSQVDLWEAFILCPQSLTSHDLKEMDLKKIQSWYIDLTNGSVFPYPPNNNQQTLQWVLSLANQQADNIANDQIPYMSDPINSSTKTQNSKPYVTYTLIAINIIMFALMTLMGGSTNPDVLILFGAKVNSLILQGEVWRLVTSMFLHIGFLHLAFNLYALWALGSMVEQLFGPLRYLIIYFVSGIIGSIASFLFVNALLSAGASGAIFGLLGALVAYSRQHKYLWNSGLGKNLVVIIVINLSLGLFQPAIDMHAHVGGLIAGLILGKLFP